MPSGAQDDEREWAAAKREFVADSRDVTADARDHEADARDSVADQRDALADLREAALNRWEARLTDRARALGVSPITPNPPEERDARRQERIEAGQERDEAAAARATESRLRDEATQRRLDAQRPTLLARAFADVAEQLHSARTFDDVLTRIAEAAVVTVDGGDYASITLREGTGYRSTAATHAAATAVDGEQYRANEGPSLDAVLLPQVEVPAFPDVRWATLGARPTMHGVHSSASYQLRGPVTTSGTGLGSLNIYASTPAAFDESALEIGAILAAHAAIAARSVGQRSTPDGLDQHLDQLLLSRDVIGQAKGILMERMKITPEDAFDILRRASQRLNLKLREVAQRLAETGEVGSR